MRAKVPARGPTSGLDSTGHRTHLRQRAKKSELCAAIATTLVVASLCGGTSSEAQDCIYVAGGVGPESTITMINASAGAIAGSIIVGPGAVDLALSPTGDRLYVTHRVAEGQVSAIDLNTGLLIDTYGVGSFPTAIVVSPSDGTVYVRNSEETLSIVDPGTGTVATVSVPQRRRGLLSSLAFNGDGTKLYIASCQEGVCIFDTATRTVSESFAIATDKSDPDPNVLIFSPTGEVLFAAVQLGDVVPDIIRGVITFIDPFAHDVTTTIDDRILPLDLAVSPDATELFATYPCRRNPVCSSGQLAVVSVANKQITRRRNLGRELGSLVFANSGQTVFVADALRGVWMVNAADLSLTDRIEVISPSGIVAGPIKAGCSQVAPSRTQTAIMTSSPSSTATTTPPSSPTLTRGPTCVGDCNRDSAVTIDELVRAVAIALDASLGNECSLDRNEDGVVGIEELIAAVTRALKGC